jgi:hypothetical protein
VPEAPAQVGPEAVGTSRIALRSGSLLLSLTPALLLFQNGPW